MSVINSFTQHTINLTRKALRLGSDFVHPVHDDTPDEPDYLSNADVFDRVVAPKLQHNGHRVAYLMIDALRFELGVALEKQLAEDGVVELRPALAQLPRCRRSLVQLLLRPSASRRYSAALFEPEGRHRAGSGDKR